MAVTASLRRWALDSKLLLAIQNNDVRGAMHLFSQGVDTDVRFAINSHKIPALCICVENNDEDMVRLLLELGASVNSYVSSGQTPLHIACEYGFYSITKMLLEFRGEPNAKNKDGKTPLHLAAKRGRRDLCGLLVEHGSCVFDEDNLGRTALHFASQVHDSDTVSYLLQSGSNASVKDISGNTPLHYASYAVGYSVSVITLLAENYPQAILMSNNDDKTPLHMVASSNRHNDLQGLEILLRHALVQPGSIPSSFSPRTDKGHTPLHLAVLERNIEAVRKLIAFGAEVDTRDQLGRTPLDCAVRDIDYGIVALLLAAGASSRRLTSEGSIAASVEDATIRKMLHTASFTPPKLVCICRRTVTRHLGPHIINLLPYMPTSWRKLLLFETV